MESANSSSTKADSSGLSTSNSSPSITSEERKRTLDEFKIIREVGTGAYGKVFLAKDKLTDKMVAIKSVDKEMIIRLDKRRHVYREKTLLTDMKHPFIIKLITTLAVSSLFLWENSVLSEVLIYIVFRMINVCILCSKTARTGLSSI